ncbi:MAG: hypothetical protein LBN27_00860 [Prevotellaceae bacterium]|jgi:hypothetical protein|nr:hypothetical protein [Prevotellaceae bacterium]
MGYRNDIALCVSGNVKNAFFDEIYNSKMPMATWAEIQLLFATSDQYQHDMETGSAYWLWNRIKWNPKFPDIEAIENFLSKQNMMDYLFIRLGEEYDDIEIKGFFWNNPFKIQPNVSISIGA